MGSPMPSVIFTPSSTEGAIFDQEPPPATNVSPDVTLNFTQIRLIHHYTTVTAKTLAHDAKSENVFATNLVQTSCMSSIAGAFRTGVVARYSHYSLAGRSSSPYRYTAATNTAFGHS